MSPSMWAAQLDLAVITGHARHTIEQSEAMMTRLDLSRLALPPQRAARGVRRSAC